MIQTHNGHGVQSSRGWHAEVPFLVRPKVTRHAKNIDGSLVYIGTGKLNKGKVYFKELFDKMFNVHATIPANQY